MARSNELNGLILIANPGSSSRKYALYDSRLKLRAEFHFERENDKVTYSVQKPDQELVVKSATFETIAETAEHIDHIIEESSALQPGESVVAIGLRIVAPNIFFMEHHLVDESVVAKLKSLIDLAPIHIGATLHELTLLRDQYPELPIVGVSDSAFHRKKPSYAWNYGINIHDADRLDIKRFGYHGLSAAAVSNALWNKGKLPPKVIVCHLGSGSSITALFHGRSIDTSMGFSPNEGVVMATRSGSISPDAAHALMSGLNLDQEGLEKYLNTQSGLRGLGGSDDIRELLEREKNGDHLAHLALTTLIHSIHKSIGAMMAAMNGCDLLVFTGTVGERSSVIRKRIVAHLEFAEFIIDGTANEVCVSPDEVTFISQTARSRPIAVAPTNESLEIAKQVRTMLANRVQ